MTTRTRSICSTRRCPSNISSAIRKLSSGSYSYLRSSASVPSFNIFGSQSFFFDAFYVWNSSVKRIRVLPLTENR